MIVALYAPSTGFALFAELPLFVDRVKLLTDMIMVPDLGAACDCAVPV